MLKKLEKGRALSAVEMGIVSLPTGAQDEIIHSEEDAAPVLAEAIIEDNDPLLIEVKNLLEDGFAGVILTGPPGTGKSRYARMIARNLAGGSADRIFFSQFHPGYQYEDFIESYTPTKDGGFELKDKVFLLACDRAKTSDEPVILVIDELSRTDVVRVFGEALTYLEISKRNLEFSLASGRTICIPKNLIVIGTMNPWDRGVEDLDLALERRFARITIEPDINALKQMLIGSTLSEDKKAKLEQFFLITSKSQNLLCRIGHAYFQTAKSEDALKRLWKNQLSFHFEKVLRLDEEELNTVNAAWQRIFQE